MNAILGFTQLLLRDDQASPEQRQRLERIERSGNHLLAIVNEILEMARIESGRLILSPVRFDLSQMLNDIREMFGLRAHSQDIAFTLEYAHATPVIVLADETKLRQVLINLLGTAFKFTPASGRIVLRLRLDVHGNDRSRLVAEVEDSGTGIAPEDSARLFEPFFQTDAGRMAGGTGLGLAISREFARLMGGDLTVESAPGRGSRFVLEAVAKVVGVRYVGADPANLPGAPKDSTDADMPPVEAMKRLPGGLLQALGTAVTAGDRKEMLALVTEISKLNAALGQWLQGLVQRYENETLLRLLQQTQDRDKPPGS
jgi:hypothetical protein